MNVETLARIARAGLDALPEDTRHMSLIVISICWKILVQPLTR